MNLRFLDEIGATKLTTSNGTIERTSIKNHPLKTYLWVILNLFLMSSSVLGSLVIVMKFNNKSSKNTRSIQ